MKVDTYLLGHREAEQGRLPTASSKGISTACRMTARKRVGGEIG